MVTFNVIKPVITSACKLTDPYSTNVEARYGFELNLVELEKGLNKLDPTLHVMATVPNVQENMDHIQSIPFYNFQITNIMEYLHKKKEIVSLIDNKYEFLEFMIFCTDIEDKKLKQEIIDAITDPQTGEFRPVVLKCLDTPSNTKMVPEIISNLPIYKILVLRGFNYNKDKFTYTIDFRSNYEMIDYVNKKFIKHDNKE